MSDPFDWQIGEEDDELPPYEAHDRASKWYWAWPLSALLITAVITAFVIGGYKTGTKHIQEFQEDYNDIVQANLDLQTQAMKEGDGDLFFGLHEKNAGWQAAQLLPENQAFYKASPQVTRVQVQDDMIWANVSATVASESINRIMFFSQSGQSIEQVASDPAFWGRLKTESTSWGELSFYEADEVWLDQFDTFVSDVVAAQCAKSCLEDKTTFTLVISKDYGDTAVKNEIRLPSPRIYALDNNGTPATLYWARLEQAITNQITPATVRFGIPPSWFPIVDYEQAAEQFMALHPDITIELVPLDTNDPEQVDYSALQLDGATLFPTESMLASGVVRNLSTYFISDPTFDHSDFYTQLLQASCWKEQFWLVPQAGQMRMLYYDRNAYQRIDHPEPSLRWTWDEMQEDMNLFAASDIGSEWGFLDAGNDALFSYAYNWSNNRLDSAGQDCDQALKADAVEATLEWYLSQAGQPGHMPDMTRLKMPLPTSIYDQEARTLILSNWQSAHRRSVIWVEDPKHFELMYLLGPMGVVPFPGSDRFDGTTPVWVHGHIIYQDSKRPLATWEWISYLSNQPLSTRFRYVPARSSVAIESEYWATLPRQLSEPMRTAVPFARPILIEEQHLFSWDDLTAVYQGTLTPAQVAAMNYQPNWFGANK